MTVCEPGDIVLVRFPFTDLSSSKRRPGLIVSPSAYTHRLGDVVLVALTSQDQHDSALAVTHWQDSGLPKPTWVKPVIGTLAADLIHRRIGHLHPGDRGAVKAAIAKLLADDWT